MQQQSAIDKFIELKVGALFMKQGTGKTRVALELANSTDSDLALFLVPASLVSNIKTEIAKWGLNIPYLIETYQGIAQSDKRYLQLLEELKNHSKVIAIADESTFIKNEESKTFNRMLQIAKLTEFRLILNGTPITKNEWDLYNQMYWLSPKILKMSREEFRDTFFTKVRYKKRNQSPKEFYKFSKVNIDALEKLIAPYIYEVDLEFEKKLNTSRILCTASAETTVKYFDLKNKLLFNLMAGADYIVRELSEMQYLIFTDEERLEQIALDLKDKGQIVVFCSYIKEVEYISNRLECYVITGDTPKAERDSIIEKFKNSDAPLLMTYGTGSYGLNLQFCNQMAFTSLTFDYGKVEQAKYRIKRIGQESDIKYIHYTSELGIFDMIEENLIKKRGMHQLITEAMEGGEFEGIL